MPETLIYHEELLNPIRLPKMGEPQVIISLSDYRAYELFRVRVDQLEHVIDRARLEGRLEGLRLILGQVDVAQAGRSIVMPGLTDSLKHQIGRLEADLRELETLQRPMKPPAPAGADQYEGRPSEGIPASSR